MLHQLYQYDDAIIRWSWRQVRGGRGRAGIIADDDTGTTLAVSNIGLVKRWLRLMSFESSSLIREREPLRYWLSVARRWEFHRIWECNLSSWLRCFVFKAPAVSISHAPALSRWAIETSLSITGYNDIGRAVNSKLITIIERMNEWKLLLMMMTSQKFESSIVCHPQEHTIRVSVSQWWWLIDWSSSNYRLIKRIDTEWVSDWVSISVARGCLIAWMRLVLTLTHTHWGTHTHTQWCKYQSGDAQIKCQRASMSQRLAVCVASRTKLAHTHTSIWLLLLSHWTVSFSCVCVCWCFSVSLWVREHADTRWMIRNTTDKREIKWWWLNHKWQHYTLSRALRARGRRATLTSWDRCRFVPQYKW